MSFASDIVLLNLGFISISYKNKKYLVPLVFLFKGASGSEPPPQKKNKKKKQQKTKT